MAASASLSSSFSLNTPHRFSLNASHRFSVYSSKPTVFSSLQHYRHLFISGNYNSRKNGISRIMELNNRRDSFLKHFVYAQQEPQPYQVNDEDRSGSNDFQTSKRRLSGLKSLMLAYKEAILCEDEKTMYEVEDIIFNMDKENRELAQKISALSAEISSGKEKYIRLQADFENYRKRSEKERITIRSNAQGEVIESLLSMVDSFERAKQLIKLETEKEKKIDTSYQGIYKQFVEIMRSLRVTAVPTVGKQFDPLMHEAIAREESHEFKEGIIIQEFRRGFYLGDRLLRPAMVKVSSGPGKKKPPSVQERSTEQPPSVVGVENHY